MENCSSAVQVLQALVYSAGVGVGGIAAEEVVGILPAGEQPSASHPQLLRAGLDAAGEPGTAAPEHRRGSPEGWQALRSLRTTC